MPRCQRTFRRLPAPPQAAPPRRFPVAVSATNYAKSGAPAPALWVCPFCPDAETYETPPRIWGQNGENEENGAVLRDYAAWSYTACVRDFGAPPDVARPYWLLTGLHPECVLEADLKRYDIYLQRGSDGEQLRLQVGHEMFHRVCSRGRVFHWTHEALACLQSVRLLREAGLADYADQTEARYTSDSARLSFAAFSADIAPPPPFDAEASAAFYGRAFVTARALECAAGQPALRRLAACAHEGNAPATTLSRWLSRSAPDVARAVRAALSD